MFIRQKDVEELQEYNRKETLVSMYIYSSPSEANSDFDTRLRSFTDEAVKKLKESKEQNAVRLSKKLPQIREKILSNFVASKGQSFCVFICSDFVKIMDISLKLRERFVIDSSFYLNPLFSAMEQFNRYAVLLFDRQSAKLFNCFAGKIKEEEEIFHDYVIPNFNPSSGSWKGFNEKKIAHRIENTFHRHLKEISHRVFAHFKAHSFDKLIIASHDDERNAIKKHLHSYLMKNTVGEFTADVKQHPGKIKELIRGEIKKYRSRIEKENIKNLLEGLTHNTVAGLDDVIKELMRGNIRVLIINRDFRPEGYSCPEQHFISTELTEDKKCPICGLKLEKNEFLEDEIIEQAHLSGAEVFHILHCTEDFSEYKTGAFLRF